MRKLSSVSVTLRGRRAACSLAWLALVILLTPTWTLAQTLPKPTHIVIVVEENHSYKQIFDSETSPFMNNELIAKGALLTSFYASHHPSQPNYFVLFSGDRQGIIKNDCLENHPLITAPSLGGQLIRNGRTFRGYAEDMPSAGFTKCKSGKYARKHVPWIAFADVPTITSLPFSAFPTDFNDLPTVSMVIPNLDNDMHDPKLPIFAPSRRTRADNWLRDHLGAYAEWAQTHNSLLIITWDEDDDNLLVPHVTTPPANHVATIFYGEMIKPGSQSVKKYNHVDLLKTLLELSGVPQLPTTENASVITDIWR